MDVVEKVFWKVNVLIHAEKQLLQMLVKIFLKDDGHFDLDVKHSYYYQVQAQIKLCSVEYCDFVVWREEELVIQRIVRDNDFIMDAFSKCEQFIKLAVLPEMLGKWYTKKSTSTIAVESTKPDSAVSMKPDSEQGKQQLELGMGEFVSNSRGIESQ